MVLIETSININASPEKVREILLDLPAHNDWDPFLNNFALHNGAKELVPGAQIQATIQHMNRIMYPTIRTNTPEEFSWDGILGAAFLFNGYHFFRFEKNQDGSTKFTHGEDFTGPLASAFFLFSNTEILSSKYNELNEALKKRVESKK